MTEYDHWKDALAYWGIVYGGKGNMKQANLKELKCGAIVCTEYRGKPCSYYRFIGVNAEGNAVIESDGGVNRRPEVIHGEVLYIPPVKKEMWVNLYKDGTFKEFYEKGQSDFHAHLDGTTTYRIGGKAFRIEYEE